MCVLGLLLETCHGCGCDLLLPAAPPALLCDACAAGQAWLLS